MNVSSSDRRPKADIQIQEVRTFRLKNDQPFAIIGHNPTERLITDFWFGNFETDENFRLVGNHVCEMLQTGTYSYWLADMRHLTQSFYCSEDWVAGDLFPRAVSAGLKRKALVLPPNRNLPTGFDSFGSASNVIRKITDHRVSGFHNLERAYGWLFGDNLQAMTG
ncbi:MAG: hypothetical protein RLN77_00275 [Rhodospirillales bacterium]